MSIEECIHKKETESQRKEELERYGTNKGCKGYYDAGCYEYNGLNTNCKMYKVLTKKQDF